MVRGLAIAQPAIRDNEIYNVERLRLIFYDNPFWGPYYRHFARIFREPRYFDLRSNLRHFAAVYERARNNRRPQRHKDDGSFFERYRQYMDREALRVGTQLASMDASVGTPAEALS